jgi:hypothetical protein
MDRSPFFMFGFDRSGTTLLSMMVGAHPDLAVPFSCTGLWYRYAGKLERYGNLEEQDNLTLLVGDLLREERIQLWDVPLTSDDVLSAIRGRDYPSVVAAFHSAYAAKLGKPRWGNIDIATIDDMDVVNAWFADARFIHIVRDGRDVALSHEKYRYGLSNTLETAMQWDRRVSANLKMGSILGEERYLVIRYEDLVLHSKDILQKICDFLGVRFSEEMLEYDKSVRRRVPEEKLWLWPKLDSKPDKNNTYRWKEVMSRNKRIVFERNAGELLAKLGYDRVEEGGGRVGAHFLELLHFLGRGHRLRRLSRRIRGA